MSSWWQRNDFWAEPIALVGGMVGAVALLIWLGVWLTSTDYPEMKIQQCDSVSCTMLARCSYAAPLRDCEDEALRRATRWQKHAPCQILRVEGVAVESLAGWGNVYPVLVIQCGFNAEAWSKAAEAAKADAAPAATEEAAAPAATETKAVAAPEATAAPATPAAAETNPALRR